MNQITTALVAAGVKLPTVKQRIFNWLKDHPEKTRADIMKGLQFPYDPAQAISDMEHAGVIKYTSDINRHTNQKVKRYSVAVATFPEGYIGPKKPQKKTPTHPSVVNPAPQAAATMPKPEAFSPDDALRGLTLQQMHAVYKHLQQYFGA